MKRIQLRKINLAGAEILSRDQMKNVLGKMMGGSGDDAEAKCGASTCGKWVGGSTGHWEAGTCSMGKPLGGLPAICECSNGGSGCTTVEG